MTFKKMRHVISLVLVFALTLPLTACGGGLDKDTRELKGNPGVEVEFSDEVYSFIDYDETATIEALTEFSIQLLAQDMQMEIAKGEKDKNVLISPVSVMTALGMTTYGAKGETLSEMEDMFGVNRGSLTRYNSDYLSSLSEEVKIANSIWFTKENYFEVNDIFLQFNEEYYGAQIYETAFNNATVKSINNWVKEHTDGMIKDILDEIPADAVMYLINALAFEAEWASKYESTDIHENAEFTNSKGEKEKVDMMHSMESYYLEDAYAKGFLKYYKGSEYAFVALLPEEGMSVSDYVKTLSGEALQNMLDNPVQTPVSARLPQFSYEYGVQMQDVLKEMGMVTAFDASNADFTALGTSTLGNIYMNRVIHKTFIEVSPVGTKAGAATVVEMMNESAGPYYEDMKEVYLDRPFLYMIIDCENNMPLFIGTVNSVE